MEWKTVKLGDWMEFNPKRTIPKNTMARKITMDLLIPHDKHISKYVYEPYSGGAKFQNGDTIMARITPCLENGKHAFVSCLNEGEIAYGSTEYIVLCGKEGVSDNDFVYYLSHTPIFKDTAIKSMVGSSGRQRAQVDVLQNLKMRVPASLTEQKQIAAILSSLDAKIENNAHISANLESQAQALYQSWFVDFEPWDGAMPEDWRTGKVGDLCITNKRTYNGKYIDSIEYIDTGSVTKNRLSDIQILNPATDKIPSRAKRLVSEGDIIYSSVRPNQCHYMFMYDPSSDMVVSTGFIVITANWSAYRYYIYQYLIQDSTIKSLQAIAEQSVSTYPSINAADITNLDIVIPSNDIIDKYAKLMNRIMQQIEDLQKESKHLAALRDTLLPKLMKGEIEI